MSEMEQLKKNADDALRKQRYDALNLYIGELSVTIDAALLKSRKASLIHMATCVGWIATIFTGVSWLHAVGWFAFLVTLLYSTYCDREFSKAIAEFDGMHNTLKLLGLITCECDKHGKKRKRKRVLNEMRDVVKGWAIKKKEAQDKVFAPA